VADIEPTDTTIGRVYPVASATARTITIHARIKNPDGRLPAGVTAMASILLRVSATEEVLVPAGCVVQDDLETVVFMQDREDPEQVVRLAVAIGRRSGEWVEVLTEVGEGDKLVENGIHQLREAGNGKAPSGGHFHADGTWHLEDK
jgi:multidrug efflux pump subunit AcrA (membrane-fusion protein)